MTGSGLPAGRAVRWDDRVRLVAGGAVLLGGAPWAVLRIAEAGRPFARRLAAAGPAGLVPVPGIEHALADLLVRRGVAHPVVAPADGGPRPEVEVVVPAYGATDGDADALDGCLAALTATCPGVRVIVVDDASPSPAVSAAARRHGVTLLRHTVNRGPAAARNTGLREVRAPLVAFVDADCAATPGWLTILAGHFDDPLVVAAAPRVAAAPTGSRLLDRYQQARSALDMGPRPELVTHGAPLGFLPSAALMVRRDALPAEPFDERLRVGEDVDLVWRLIDDGAVVRYEPAATVTHRSRPRLRDWAGRIYAYGTSAADLDRRHPGRLTPARLSGWNVAAAVLLLARRPSPALRAAASAACLGAATVLLARTLGRAGVDPRVAPQVTATGVRSDADAAGHLLRREWWPVGVLALSAVPRSPVARAAAAVMLAAPVREWLSRRPDVGLLPYLALRLVEDAAYGTGVIAGALRARYPRVVVPVVRRPRAGNPEGRLSGPAPANRRDVR